MKELIKKLEHTHKTILIDTIEELAFEYITEDGKSKEEIIEEHEEIAGEIENIDPQDDENKIWDSGYARWKEVAYFEIINLLKENN